MLANGFQLKTIRAGKLRWLVRGGALPTALLEQPDNYLARKELLIKSSDIVTIGRVPPEATLQFPVILRRLNYRSWRHCLRDVFRPSRAKSAMLRGLAFEAAGVPTPKALAVTEQRRCRWPVRAYLVTEEIPGAMSIELHIRRGRGVSTKVIENMAAALARMHQCGFSHRDLKPSNVLISEQQQIALIDLDAVRFFRQVSQRRAMADLARFTSGIHGLPGTTPLVLARFIRDYCRFRQIDHWQDWWRKLAARLPAERRWRRPKPRVRAKAK